MPIIKLNKQIIPAIKTDLFNNCKNYVSTRLTFISEVVEFEALAYAWLYA